MSQMKTERGHNHKEAFCIMSYRCSDCGHEERIWNSRDGVTPLGIGCPKCKGHNMCHVDWQMDFYAPLQSIYLKPGDRYFVDMTMERARQYASIRVDAAIEAGRLKSNQRNYTIGEVAKSYFHEGTAPDIMVKT